MRTLKKNKRLRKPRKAIPKPGIGLVVDASVVDGNPGYAEYQIHDLKTKKIIYKSGVLREQTTNNVAEFLALCMGIWITFNQQRQTHVYSDSITAIAWVRNKKLNTTSVTLEQEIKNALFMLHRISINGILPVSVKKWETKFWGENPADFGNKPTKKFKM